MTQERLIGIPDLEGRMFSEHSSTPLSLPDAVMWARIKHGVLYSVPEAAALRIMHKFMVPTDMQLVTRSYTITYNQEGHIYLAVRHTKEEYNEHPREYNEVLKHPRAVQFSRHHNHTVSIEDKNVATAIRNARIDGSMLELLGGLDEWAYLDRPQSPELKAVRLILDGAADQYLEHIAARRENNRVRIHWGMRDIEPGQAKVRAITLGPWPRTRYGFDIDCEGIHGYACALLLQDKQT